MTSANKDCPASTATLVIADRVATFAPGDGTWILTGPLTGDRVKLSRDKPSFDHKTYATAFDATLADGGVIGRYSTPFCAYDVKLRAF